MTRSIEDAEKTRRDMLETKRELSTILLVMQQVGCESRCLTGERDEREKK